MQTQKCSFVPLSPLCCRNDFITPVLSPLPAHQKGNLPSPSAGMDLLPLSSAQLLISTRSSGQTWEDLTCPGDRGSSQGPQLCEQQRWKLKYKIKNGSLLLWALPLQTEAGRFQRRALLKNPNKQILHFQIHSKELLGLMCKVLTLRREGVKARGRDGVCFLHHLQ